MRALAGSGRRTEALRTYRSYPRYSRKRSEPNHPARIAALDRKIARSEAVDEADVAPGNLPIQSTSFVGRRVELQELTELARSIGS